MTPQELKNSILQLAIQGRLAEQRPEEGTAQELYQQIQAEKQRLIREGKIKKEKPLPEITEDEKPFDIPESWMWVYFGNVITLISGTDFKPSEYNDQGRGTVYITGASSLSDDGVIISRWTESPKNYAHQGDILLVCKGSGYGKTVLCNVSEAHIARQIMAIQKINTIEMRYVLYFLQANLQHLKTQGQGVIPGIDRKSVLNMPFPLPPRPEQKRIVAKIKELLPLVDRYEAAWTRLEDFNRRFPEDMKKSLLQYAIQGKLVEQRPEEGTAQELYQQTQAEKQRLVKEGKIKKEKPLPEITEDEKPFDIPETWKWVRLSQIAVLENGDRSSKYPIEKDYVDFGIPFFGAKDIDGATMSFDNARYISQEKFSELGNGKLKDYDFVCLLRGSVGKSAVFRADKRHQTGFICAQMVIVRCIDLGIFHYLRHFLSSPFYNKYIESKVTGTAVRQLPAKELGNTLIPLPPLAEQKRIVARLEELLPLCEGLK